MRSDRLLRVGYSFLGLLAGDAALLVLVVFNALRTSLLQHGRLMGLLLQMSLEWFSLVAIVSIAGWMMVGVPAVLILSANRIVKTARWQLLLAGALLGPLALMIVFLLLSRGKVSSEIFTNTGLFWICASIISTIAFGVHCALVRRSERRRLRTPTE